MRFQNIYTSILAQFAATNRVAPFILGAPGGGKSACARAVAREFLASKGLPFVEYDAGSNNIDSTTVVEFNASLREPTDVLGLPVTTGDHSKWLPPAEFHALRKGTGTKVLILEELSDGSVPMQNALCRVIYDRHAGNLALTDDLYIIATGNRTEDKSGANRVVTKLGGRVRYFDFTENLDDWTEWALDAGVKVEIIQFLRFRPGLLSDFNPNARSCPTPRNWERVSMIPDSLPDELYFDNVKGDVGDGAAAEYVGFKKIYDSLPSIDAVLLDPKNHPVPTDPAVRYAITGALARRASPDNFESICTYINRLPPEFSVMTVKDAIKLEPKLKSTRSFISWATANASVLM